MTEFYEADAFDIDLMLSNLAEVERDASERMRMIVWAVLAPNLKEGVKPDNIITFSWEKEQEQTPVVTTREDFERAFARFKKP